MKLVLNSIMAAMLAGAAVPALALNAAIDAKDVNIQEGAVTGTPNNAIVADQLNGNYTEIFSATSATTFNTLAVFNATGWTNNGSSVPAYLNSLAPNGYNLYAVFQSDGSFSSSGGVTTFNGGNGTLQLWADASQDTTKALPGTAAGNTIASITLGNTADDQLLGTASLLTAGNGHGFPGTGANGDFELVFGDWTLNGPAGSNGDAYFTAPRPFYMVLDLNGNFQSFDPLSATDILLPQSSANAFFTIPEPGPLALMGVGMAAMGLSLRRRKGKAKA
jgi:hypothetical protein